MTDKVQLITIVVAVLFGVVSATYFYGETKIFTKSLQRPLQLIACGMFVISIAVMLSAYISYMYNLGTPIEIAGLPAASFFYWLYLLGSILISFGASSFATKPKPLFVS